MRNAVADREWVFHLGALIAIPYSYQNPHDVVQTNVLGTAHVLDACRASALERVVLTSTSEVYGTARYVPIDEKHPLCGQSPYAATQDRRRCPRGELPPRLRPAGGDPPPVQHVRSAAVGPCDHPDDHQPGAHAAGREAGPDSTPAAT